MNPQIVVLGVIWYVVFLLSTMCHEGAHALVAHLGGDSTAFHGGQVSLSPLPHIQREPFGTVVVPWLTYILPPHFILGWASAPYDPAWEQRKRGYIGRLKEEPADTLLVSATANCRTYGLW